MVGLHNRKDVEARLKTQPRETSVILAARAAARVAPAVTSARLLPYFDILTLAIFRAIEIARLIASYPERQDEVQESARAAVRAAADFDQLGSRAAATRNSGTRIADSLTPYIPARYRPAGATTDGRRISDSVAAYAPATRAAANAAASAAASYTRDVAVYAAAAAAFADSAAYVASSSAAASSDAAADEDLRHLRIDARLWARGGDIDRLPPRLGRSLPDVFADFWSQLKSTLLARNENWQVWTDWYDAWLDGRPVYAEVAPARREQLEFDICLIPDADWKQGPAHVNAIIARLIAEAAAEGEAPEPPQSPPPLPDIPAQGPGPHLRIDEETGLIAPAAPGDIDAQGNNVARLTAQHPRLRDFAKDLVAQVSRNEQPELYAAAQRYLAGVDKDLAALDFEFLWGEGVYLEAAQDAAARRIEQGLREPLPDHALATLTALVSAHGNFILSTRAGQENLALARQWEERPHETRERETAERSLAEAMRNAPEVFDPRVAASFADAVQQDASPVHPERSAAFRASYAQNVTITLGVGALIGGAVVLTSAKVGVVAAGVLGGMVWPYIEGLKKSKGFIEIQESFKTKLDGLSDQDLVGRLRKVSNGHFEKYADFMLRHEDTLRKVAGTRPRGRWLQAHLDWLKVVWRKPEAD